MLAQRITCLLVCGLLTLFTACRTKVECQNPPPVLQLLLRNADGTTAADTSNARRVAIRYYSNRQLMSVKDIRVDYGVQSYDMVTVSRQSADTTRFYLSIADKPFGVVQLKTYIDQSPCDGWTHVGELRYNGAVIPFDNLKPGYTLIGG